MQRRTLLFGLGSVLAVGPAAPALAKSMPAVGILTTLGIINVSEFQRGLRETGLVDGRDVRIIRRYLHGRFDRLPGAAADLVHAGVGVIAAFGPAEARAARRASATTPIVFLSLDPVIEGLVASLARPGGNLTGVSMIDAELMPKRLEFLAALAPQAQIFGLLVNPVEAEAAAAILKAQEAASARGVQLRILTARSESELYAAFDKIQDLNIGGLIVDFGAFYNSKSATLAALAAIAGVPAIYGWSGSAHDGGLISYGASIDAAHRLMGIYCGKILKGARPADLPVAQPDKFELVINLKAAKALGVTVPPSLLARADTVIE